MLPVLDALARDPQARALLLYPTKALAQDQARKIAALRLRGAVVSLYDGDTPQAQRAAIRKRAAIVLSNPDMLHLGILPGHEQWAEFLHHLRYVVLDEAHVYRGVFGSHVAQVMRRLRRLCAVYGSAPRFVLSSATMADPQPFAERLVGLPFSAVTESGAPVPEQTDRALEPAPRRPGPRPAQERPGRGQLPRQRGGAARRARDRLRPHAQGDRARLQARHAAARRPPPRPVASACSPIAPATRRSSDARSNGACSTATWRPS